MLSDKPGHQNRPRVPKRVRGQVEFRMLGTAIDISRHIVI